MYNKKTSFKLKLIRRDKEEHFIIIKETVKQKDITILKIYAPNSGALNFLSVLEELKIQINIIPLTVGVLVTVLCLSYCCYEETPLWIKGTLIK